MKLYFLIPLVFLTACASKRAVVQMSTTVPGTTLSSDGIESVRYSENIKAYPVGRYIDPNNGLIMHERHTIYRVETTPKWNLNPNAPATVPLGPPLGLIDPAKHDAPMNADAIAEVNRQKAATQALLAQGPKISQAISQLTAAVQAISEQNQQLRRESSATQQRLNALEDEVRKTETDASADANQNTKTNEW